MVSDLPWQGIDAMGMFSVAEGYLTIKNSFLQRLHSYNFDTDTKRIQNFREIRTNASLEQYGHLLLVVTRMILNFSLNFISQLSVEGVISLILPFLIDLKSNNVYIYVKISI
jgi:hypothetical protein